MHARPEVPEPLLAKKMQRWAPIGAHPTAYPNVSPTRARRNYSRLYARYPELAHRLKLTMISATRRFEVSIALALQDYADQSLP